MFRFLGKKRRSRVFLKKNFSLLAFIFQKTKNIVEKNINTKFAANQEQLNIFLFVFYSSFNIRIKDFIKKFRIVHQNQF